MPDDSGSLLVAATDIGAATLIALGLLGMSAATGVG